MTYALFTALFILSFLSGFLSGVYVFPPKKHRKTNVLGKNGTGLRELNRELYNFMNYDGTKQP